MSLYLLQGAVEEGFIYAFVALGLFVSYQILDVADLTTDGSFALGGVVAAMITSGGHPVAGLPAAFLAGALAGLVTAFLQTRMKVPAILAGIITMTALYSINLMIMGGAELIPADGFGQVDRNPQPGLIDMAHFILIAGDRGSGIDAAPGPVGGLKMVLGDADPLPQKPGQVAHGRKIAAPGRSQRGRVGLAG